MPVRFVPCSETPACVAERGPISGPAYAVFQGHSSIPLGWVARGEDGTEWLAWNAYGDFWTGFADTRRAAFERMLSASWMAFSRRQ